MSTPFRLFLPRHLYLGMIAQAKAELPNECCGILAGRRAPDGKTAIVEQCHPLVNAAGSPVEFLSEPRSMLAAHKAMRLAGHEELAIYHSHPTSPPVPSSKDRERNYSEGVMSLIISLAQAEPIMGGWWLTADDFRPADWEIVEDVLSLASPQR